MSEKPITNEQVASLVNQLIGDSMATQAVMRGMLAANGGNPKFRAMVRISADTERKRRESLIPSAEIEGASEETLARILEWAQ